MRARQRGYLLVTVVVTMFLLATIAMMLSAGSAVNANTTTGELEATQADHVVQAAMRNAVWIASRKGCSDYALPATNLGTHSYAATFSPTFGSPSHIVANATHASGIKRSLSRSSVTVYDLLTPRTGTLTPGAEGKDAYIEGDPGHTDHNKGDDNELWTSSETGSEYRSLLQFDFSGLPPTAIVQSATLELYLNSQSSIDVVEAHRLLRNWTEGEVTWNNYDDTHAWDAPGGDYDPEIVASFLADSLGPKSLDITDITRAWLSGSLPNYGLILLSPPNAGGDKNKFHSTDKTNEPWPRLTLTYACECGTSCPGIAVSDNVVLSTDSDAVLGGLSFTDVDLVAYAAAADSASLRFDGGLTTLNKDIDAVHELENGHIVISAKEAAEIGGLFFDADDLVEYDPATDTATMFFDGSQHFPGDENIVSLHVLRNGQLILSTSSDAMLGGVAFSDNDLIRYDPVSGSASIFFDGDALGLTSDIAALHVLENGHIVMAVDGNATVGGLSFTPADIVEYDPSADAALMYFAGSTLFGDANEKVISTHIEGDLGPAGYMLLVVGNASNPSDKDAGLRNLFESWTYVVEFIDDAATQADFDAGAAVSDVAYISGSVDPAMLAGKLTAGALPLVSERSALITAFGFSELEGFIPADDALSSTDPTHYITEPFGGGAITLFTSDISMPVAQGATSGDLLHLGMVVAPSEPALAALYAGADQWNGVPAAARRVQVPFENAGVLDLSADGLTLLQRSIEWASGEGCDFERDLLLVVSDDANPTSQEIDRRTMLEAWCNRVTLIDDSQPQATLDAAALANDVVFVPNEIDKDELGAKLRNSAKGIVVEEIFLFKEFGFSSAFSQKYRSQIDVVDNGHYITSGFPTGLLTVFTSDQFNGIVVNLVPSVNSLALLLDNGIAWKPSLATIEVGGELYDGGNAAGRRVKLPWADYSFAAMTDAGRTITRRAIEWAADSGETPPAGLVAHWKLDETGGTMAVDSVGGHDGTLVNGPSWASGVLDGGLSFDGNNDYIDVSSINPRSYDDFTLSAWYKSAGSSVSDDEYIYMHAEGFITEGLTFGPTDDSGDAERLRLTIDVGNVADEHYGTSDIVDQQWHHLVAVRADGRIKLYVDDTKESDEVDAHAGVPVVVDGAGPFIGDYPGGTEQVHGILDDVRLYDQGLSDSEIAALFAAGGGIGGGGGGGGGGGEVVLLSTVANATFGGATFGDDDVADYDMTALTATMRLDGSVFSSTEEDINAVHLLPDGRLVLSTTGNATLGGLNFGDDDLIVYDPVSDSGQLLVDGSVFSSTNEDIDAVCVLSDGVYLMSTTTDASIAGLSVGDDDLFAYNANTGEATMYLDGGSVFSASDEDINAVHVLDTGTLLISTTGNANLGGLSFGDDDIVEYDASTDTATLFLDGAIFSDTDEDIDAISLLN